MDGIHPLMAYREQRQISQAKLAEELGVTRASVSRWESGSRKPKRGLLPKIARKTGIPIDELLGETTQ